MRAFYDPLQAAHDPSQLMRYGRIVTPNDSPERTVAPAWGARRPRRSHDGARARRSRGAAGRAYRGLCPLSVDSVGTLADAAQSRARGVAEHVPLLERPARGSRAAGLPGGAHRRADGVVSRRSLGVDRAEYLAVGSRARRTRRWRRPMRWPPVAVWPMRCAARPDTTRAPIAPPASAFSTTPRSPPSACARRSIAWRSSTWMRITATARSRSSIHDRTS